MPKKNAHTAVIRGFASWLHSTGRVSQGTAGNYAATVSAAIHKHAAGWEDKNRLEAFITRLAAEQPAQARTFHAAWGYFIDYMRTQGVTVMHLPAPGRVHVGPPAAATYDLRSNLSSLPLGAFAELRWGQVRTTAARTAFVDALLKDGRPVVVQLTPKGVEALAVLQLWGWPHGVPSRNAHIIPDTPGAEMCFEPRALSRLLRMERRARTAPVVLAEGSDAPEASTEAPSVPFGDGGAPLQDDAAAFDAMMADFGTPQSNGPSDTDHAPAWAVGDASVVFGAPVSGED